MDTPGTAQDVSIREDRTYVAGGGPGIQVVEVSNPDTPAIVGTVDTGDARDVEGGYVLVAD